MKIRFNVFKLIGLLALGFTLFAPSLVQAHGTAIDVIIDGNQVEIGAKFDNGDPMSEAQILVYPPTDPQTAWHTGVADANGIYAFEIDSSQAGEWAVSMRSAGHGQIIYLDVAANGVITSRAGASEHNNNQSLFMAAAVIIALGGIAYWFSRPRPNVAQQVPVPSKQ